jgi:hypothetical protein
MPRGPLHDQKKSKNWAIFIAVFAFVAVIFAVTIIRMKGG